MNDIREFGSHGAFVLGAVTIDPPRLIACAAGVEHRLAPKHMAVLLELARHAPAVVSRTELMNAVWPRGFVDPAVLGNAISRLRKTLEACGARDSIETVPKRGYRLTQCPAAADTRNGPAWTAGSPYLGLQAFDSSRQEIFFGREVEIEEIVAALHEQAQAGRAFVLILGPSGSGKTSLVHAGIVPWLRGQRQPEQFRCASVALVRGDSGPWRALADAFAPSRAASTELARRIELEPDFAANHLTEALGRNGAESERLLLVVDQLELLFREEPVAAEVEEFLQVLHALARGGRVWILATLRSDFYPVCLGSVSLRALMRGHGHYELGVPGPAQIRRIIRGPAVAAGLTFELDAASGVRLDEVLHAEAADQPEVLPLLEFALDELYKRRRDDGCLTYAAHAALGGVGGCLARRAEETFQHLPERVQFELDFVFQQLAHFPAAATAVSRRVVPVGAVCDSPGRKALVDAFVAARLLVVHVEDGEPVVSVAHEALFRHWARLRQLLERNRRLLRARERLVVAANSWREHGRSPTYLLAPGPLNEAQEVAEQPSLPLGWIERELISASRRRLEGARRARFAAMLALLVLSAAAVGAALWANQQRVTAQTESRRAAQATEYLLDLFRLADPGQARPHDVSAHELFELGVRQIEAGAVRDPQLQARLKSAIGTVYMNLGRQELAEKLLTEALSISRSNPAFDPLIAIEPLNALGKLRYHQSRYQESRPYYEQARALALSAGEAGPRQLAQVLNNLGEMEAALGNFAEAERQHREALRLRDEAFGARSAEAGSSWQNIAGVLRQNGQLAPAEDAYRRAIAIQEAALGERHPELAVSLTNLGLLLNESGAFEESAALHRRALAIRRDTLGDSHPQTANSLHNLSALLFSQRDYQSAEPLLRESIERHIAIFGERHAAVAYGRNNLATLLLETGRNAEALALFETAHASIREILGPGHPNTALLRANLAKALTAVGRHTQARDHAQEALAVLRQRLPAGHWRTAAAQSILGGVLLRLGELDAAEEHLLASWKVLSDAQRADAPTRRATLQRVVELYEARGDRERAASYRSIEAH